MAIEAGQSNHWPLVCYFHQHHKLKTVTLDILLHTAVKHGQAVVIQTLWSQGKKLPTMHQIEKSLLLAIEKNDLESLNAILSYLPAPKEALLIRGFKKATQFSYFNLALMIVNKHPSKKLIETFEDTVLKASSTNQLELLKAFTPSCAEIILDNAFIKGARANQIAIVHYFVVESPYRPKLAILKRAWNEAKIKRPEIANILKPYCEQVSVLSLQLPTQSQKTSSFSPGSPKTQSPFIQKPKLIRVESYTTSDEKVTHPIHQHGLFAARRAFSMSCLSQEQPELPKLNPYGSYDNIK